MTPVEAVKMWLRGQFRVSASLVSTASTVDTPCPPVKALELPEFTRIASGLLGSALPIVARFSWQRNTGAERVDERVKTPARVEPGAISASITSKRPVYFTPASAAANRTPPISGKFGNPPAGASGEMVIGLLTDQAEIANFFRWDFDLNALHLNAFANACHMGV